jgi:hypothetical protein
VRYFRGIILSGLIGLSGCVRVIDLNQAGTDTDLGVDTGRSDLPCIPENTPDFRLPSARYGLAALHAERRFADVAGSELRLSANWFLASAWQTTGFGCADYGEPWSLDSDAQGDGGCLALREETVWNELCRLHPNLFACDGYAGTFAGDAPETSIFGMTWFQGAAHAMLSRFGDPNAFYAEASDPLARERVAALMHFNGPWTPELEDILTNCGDDITACVDGEYTLHHINGVSEKLAHLEEADCYDGPLTADDISAYSQALATIWPEEDWLNANIAAWDALTGEGFRVDAEGVLDAYETHLNIRLRCPEEELWDWYTFSCP